MSDQYEVYDKETGLAVNVQTLEDAHGKFCATDPRWSERYGLRDKVTMNEIVVREATQADELDDLADELDLEAEQMQIRAARLRQVADKMRGE